MSWIQRQTCLLLKTRKNLVVKADAPGTLHIKNDSMGRGKDRTIVLGEERLLILHNGDKAKVCKWYPTPISDTRFNFYFLSLAKAVTVQEGDNCLITRIKSPFNLELREEYSEEGMIQHIKHLDSDLEATRYFKRRWKASDCNP